MSIFKIVYYFDNGFKAMANDDTTSNNNSVLLLALAESHVYLLMSVGFFSSNLHMLPFICRSQLLALKIY